MATSVVCPGDPLCSVGEAVAGSGTHVTGEHICASLVGTVLRVPPEAAASDQKDVLHVFRRGAQLGTPKIGDIVTAKVTRINPRLASLDVLCIGDAPLDSTFTGSIRKQDVRATEVDTVTIADSFRPGDLVLAEVLSLGDSRSYFLGTARNELGVVHARHMASGVPMVAHSWQEMRCPQTQGLEKRKVAKVVKAV